jgi:microcystin degradation protein MlrC
VKVLALGEGVIEATMGIRSEYDMGKRALLEIGNVRVVVSENVGVGGNHPSVYQSFGIEPANAKIAVLKTASNFQYYKEITAEIIRVDSVGPTMSHLEEFNWQHLPRPIYPLDELPFWQATPENANVVSYRTR